MGIEQRLQKWMEARPFRALMIGLTMGVLFSVVATISYLEPINANRAKDDFYRHGVSTSGKIIAYDIGTCYRSACRDTYYAEVEFLAAGKYYKESFFPAWMFSELLSQGESVPVLVKQDLSNAIIDQQRLGLERRYSETLTGDLWFLVSSCLLAVICLLGGLYALWLESVSKFLDKLGVRTTAIMIRPGGPLVYDFWPSQGRQRITGKGMFQRIEEFDRLNSLHKRKGPGVKVPIIYNPKNPKQSKIDFKLLGLKD